MKKSRFFYLHPEANAGKIASLEALQVEYTAYLKTCVECLLEERRFSLPLSELQTFFPSCERLSSQIVKNARSHAVGIVSGWAAGKYTTTLRSYIKLLFKAHLIDETMRSALYIVGKRQVAKPGGKVTTQAINLYWSLLFEPLIAGRLPTISDRCGMRMSEMTATLSTSEQTGLTAWWLGFSHLIAGARRILLPLSANPYVSKSDEVSKGVLARKEKTGRWRFEVVEKKEWAIPEPSQDLPKVGLDVGLNVMASTSDGRLLGAELKPRFNRDYTKLQSVRANRQRQGLKKNSPRLDRLEAKLSGYVKTMAGQCAHDLVKAYPEGTVFVIEDLDLRGCRGQKRFAYRALQSSLATKAPTEKVNPAYSSQTCPSCGYVSRRNRSGVKFHCRSCGREGHADVVGGKNLLGRSGDKQIQTEDHPSEVKALLRARYLARRRSSAARGSEVPAPEPSGRRLTVRYPVRGLAQPRIQ